MAKSRRTGATVGADEVDRLLRAYRQRGDAAARERLIEVHMPLVRSLARRHHSDHDDSEDLVQVGTIGLIQAIERWRPERGSDFAAYAVPSIDGEIKRHLRDNGPVRVPRRLQELGAQARSSERELAAKLQRDPTTSELAEAIGATEDELASALGSLAAGTPAELHDTVAGHGDEFGASETRIDLVRALATLDADERRIVRMRFTEGAPADRIAAEAGISARQLRRRVIRILAKLRTALEEGDDQTGVERTGPEPTSAQMAEDIEQAPTPATQPARKRASKRSGRLLVRMPQGLHDDLARRADGEGVSLNALIVGILAGAIGWQRADEPESGDEAGPERARSRGRRLLPVAIVANVVVLALAAAVATALLIVILANGIN